MERKTGCLVIHGFGGELEEVLPLAEFLRAKGYEVACPELKGHTGRRKDLRGVNYRQWIASAEERLEYLQAECDAVVLIGFSMGGLIAVNLAIKHTAAALVTLNMPIYHWDIKRICLNLLQDLKAGRSDHLRRYVRSTCALPFSALINFKLILTRTKPLLHQVTCPVFIAQALEDDTVQHRSANHAYWHFGSEDKRIKYYTGSGHQICHSSAAAKMMLDVEVFLNEIIGKRI